MFISIIQEPQLLKELKTTRIDGGWNAVTTVHKVAGFPGFFKVIYYLGVLPKHRIFYYACFLMNRQEKLKHFKIGFKSFFILIDT